MFKGRHFDCSVILLCVRWYLAYGLSLRDLKEMAAERGIRIDHSTIHRWVVHFLPVLLQRFNRRKRPVGSKWHMDETYIRFVASGCISIGPSMASATPSNSGSASIVICPQPNAFCARLWSVTAGQTALSSTIARSTRRPSLPAMPRAACEIDRAER